MRNLDVVLLVTIALGIICVAVMARGDDVIADPAWQEPDPLPGIPLYPEDDCIGAVVNGVCHGTIITPPDLQPRCYGTFLNGECIGPKF